MRRQNFLSTEASKMLADLVGGQVLRFHNTSPVLLRMEYTVGGNPVDPAVVRELRDINGQSAIWRPHFDHQHDNESADRQAKDARAYEVRLSQFKDRRYRRGRDAVRATEGRQSSGRNLGDGE
jgi:hypothetical protein